MADWVFDKNYFWQRPNLGICVSDFTLARAELLASMALYPINEFAAKETCRGAEIESDAVVYRAIVDPE